MTRLLLVAAMSSIVVGCGPMLTEGGNAQTDDATMGTGEDPPSPWERLPSGCEPAPEDGDDPFADTRACGAYDGTDLPEIPRIEVRILNRRDEPILVMNRTGGCHQPSRYFVVEGTIGGRHVKAPTSFCTDHWNYCGGWTGVSGPCLHCATFHPPLRIEPGGASVTTWEAWVLGEVSLPAECNEISGTKQTCNAPISIAPGRYALRAEAARVQDCEGDCTCEPDERGSCQLAGDGEFTLTDTPFVATATFDGKCHVIDIVFE